MVILLPQCIFFYHFMKTESHSCKTSLRVSRLVIHDKEVRR